MQSANKTKKRYKSKHNPLQEPSSSTFKIPKKNHGVMGKRVKHSIDPRTYKKKMDTTLPKRKKFVRQAPPRKEAIPKKNEAPIMGLQTKKNFLRTNKLEASTAMRGTSSPGGTQNVYMNKKDYGKVPRYLKRVKKQVKKEYDYAESLKKPKDDGHRMELLPKEKREEILQGLYEQKADLLKRYQKYTFLLPNKGKSNRPLTLDNSNPLIKKKEDIERELDNVEEDIQTFSKENVYVFV